MASPFQNRPRSQANLVSTAAVTELSLRNHLCFLALRTGHGMPFHLGTIIRTMFDSFFLFDAGFGQSEITTYTDVDLALGKTVSLACPDQPWKLSTEATEPIAWLLRLFDNQLQTAPRQEIVAAHRRAEANFQAASEHRLPIPALVQRSRRNANRVSSYTLGQNM